MPEANLECLRCGHRWYSVDYEEQQAVPSFCPYCFGQDVRAIPDEPSPLEKEMDKLEQEVDQAQDRYHRWRRRLTLWKENNRYLIDMFIFFLSLALIAAVTFVLIFSWG